MATPLTLDTDQRDDGTAVLIAAGEIDLSNVAAFTDALAAVLRLDSRSQALTIDLSAVRYLDSSAINALFTQAGRVERMHVIVHPFLMPVLNISGLSELAVLESAQDT